ncbi:CRTAC1 family protein [Phycisphaera mikurensis]|uniref:ASPIC/UnbV domain-containing protein n=1 Tax=Phycisphaera mikurensis (strain NBRC 102666 / KCTC 22515 / FYK2301M01) TaxID=1142394 RepID=I0IHG6_PHYMF|nr:CRTAC1 family protein [Phycisphaera mikurensis]MBB6440951.1 hypothetical protein [Phycisphaera mikurensis]BAM04704.1 hypothetical protein PSMK_25450 [Phycisphaera mikurensis NBRC 102666]
MLHPVRRSPALLTLGSAFALAPLAAAELPSPLGAVHFFDVTASVGIVSPPDWKYGGPLVADFNGDGLYDLVLQNHDQTPLLLYFANGDGTYTQQKDPYHRADFHGLAAGDYDADGDPDFLISLGGGNATNPKPPRLLRNEGGGEFEDVTETSGFADIGGRGRSVALSDLDDDGDLDLLTINAKQAAGETGPRNFLAENLGDGTFEPRSSAGFDQTEAEKVFMTDFDGDGFPDAITFGPWNAVKFWKGDGSFGLTDVTEQWLPADLQNARSVEAVAEADFDNDGDPDYYLARGGMTNNNVVEVDPERSRLDIKTQGRVGDLALTFQTEPGSSGIDLTRFHRAEKPKPSEFPVFLGAEKEEIPAPHEMKWVGPPMAKGFPEELGDSGWYLGHLGDKQWKLVYHATEWTAWSASASFINVASYEADFKVGNPDLPDLLLRNDGSSLADVSDGLPELTGDTSRGVVAGDFNNDGGTDLFVYRHGDLTTRLPDLLLLNDGGADGGFAFTQHLDHNATDTSAAAHGDMGAAFDHDLDGKLDLFSGDADDGSWHLYENHTADADTGNFLLVRVGRSPGGVDPLGAIVRVDAGHGTPMLRVGAGASAFSQNLLDTLHFGLGDADAAASVTVTWRDGTEETLENIDANQRIEVGSF